MVSRIFQFNNYEYYKNLKSYKIHIRYGKKLPPRSQFPKETVNITNRPPVRLYKNHKEEITREIVYHTKDLWYQQVLPDDPLENYIIQIKNFYPDWNLIEIDNYI